MFAFLPIAPLRLPQPLRPTRTRTTVHATLPTILIAGGSGRLGRQLANHLQPRTKNLHTTYHTTPPSESDQTSQVTSHHLDVMSRELVFDTLNRTRPEVLISCIGGEATQPDLPDFEGNRNLIDAALEMGVRRFVLVSALGAGDSEHCVPMQVMDTMRPLLLEKSHAERYLKLTRGMEWVVARPGPLVEEGEAAGETVVTDGLGYGTVGRRGVAGVLGKFVESDKVVGKVLQIVDRNRVLITSPYVRPLEFWEELPFDEFEI